MPPELITFLESVSGSAKTALPWLTGGLAGAILTYWLNQRIARRKQPRVRIKILEIEYSLAARDSALRVSYDGQAFDRLALVEIKVENISDKTANRSPILLILDAGSSIINRSSELRPINRPIDWQLQNNHVPTYLWDSGELKPGDSSLLRLLVSPSAHAKCLWRGDDNVEVSIDGVESPQEYERELKGLIGLIALYVLCGTIPLLGHIAQAGLLLLATPVILRLVQNWRIASRRKQAPLYQTIDISGSNNSVEVRRNSTAGTAMQLQSTNSTDRSTLDVQ